MDLLYSLGWLNAIRFQSLTEYLAHSIDLHGAFDGDQDESAQHGNGLDHVRPHDSFQATLKSSDT